MIPPIFEGLGYVGLGFIVTLTLMNHLSRVPDPDEFRAQFEPEEPEAVYESRGSSISIGYILNGFIGIVVFLTIQPELEKAFKDVVPEMVPELVFLIPLIGAVMALIPIILKD